jgi:hypothetical protein
MHDPAIEVTFQRHFAYWGIELPAGRDSGQIVQEGWAIWFRFGSDEKGQFLDYYASHRMTNDRHVRIRVEGAAESLPALQSMLQWSADPEEAARFRDEHNGHNQKVAEILRAKGFGLTGGEPLITWANRVILAGDEDT